MRDHSSVTSWHEFGARQAFLDALERRGRSHVYDLVELGRQVHWCDEPDCAHLTEADIVGQTHDRREPIEQLYCRGRVEQLLSVGLVRRSAILLRQSPGPDRDRDGNQALLDLSLDGMSLTATVGGQPGETDDGVVAWQAPILLSSVDEAEAGVDPEALVRPGQAALEIGYTLPSRTLTHLMLDGAVWRWPYRSQRLWLLACVEQNDGAWRIRPGASWDEPIGADQTTPSQS